MHPELAPRVEKNNQYFDERVTEHSHTYCKLIGAVGGPDGGLDINGADKFYHAFCSKMVIGCP